MRRLGFLKMRKPLQLLTFIKSSLLLSGLHVHFQHENSAFCTCSIEWNLKIRKIHRLKSDSSR